MFYLLITEKILTIRKILNFLRDKTLAVHGFYNILWE